MHLLQCWVLPVTHGASSLHHCLAPLPSTPWAAASLRHQRPLVQNQDKGSLGLLIGWRHRSSLGDSAHGLLPESSGTMSFCPSLPLASCWLPQKRANSHLVFPSQSGSARQQDVLVQVLVLSSVPSSLACTGLPPRGTPAALASASVLLLIPGDTLLTFCYFDVGGRSSSLCFLPQQGTWVLINLTRFLCPLQTP